MLVCTMYPDADISCYLCFALLQNRPFLGNVLRSEIERIYLGSNSSAPITFNMFSDPRYQCVVHSPMLGYTVDSWVWHVITFRQVLIQLLIPPVGTPIPILPISTLTQVSWLEPKPFPFPSIHTRGNRYKEPIQRLCWLPCFWLWGYFTLVM